MFKEPTKDDWEQIDDLIIFYDGTDGLMAMNILLEGMSKIPKLLSDIDIRVVDINIRSTLYEGEQIKQTGVIYLNCTDLGMRSMIEDYAEKVRFIYWFSCNGCYFNQPIEDNVKVHVEPYVISSETTADMVYRYVASKVNLYGITGPIPEFLEEFDKYIKGE